MPASPIFHDQHALAPAILIVDDERQAHLMLPRILLNAGATEGIVHAYDGAEAIQYMDRQAAAGAGIPFLILLDLEMPGKNGLDVLRWMSERNLMTRAVIVVVTGSQSSENRAEALRRGAFAVMDKFPRPTDLLATYISARAKLPRPGPKTWTRQEPPLVTA